MRRTLSASIFSRVGRCRTALATPTLRHHVGVAGVRANYQRHCDVRHMSVESKPDASAFFQEGADDPETEVSETSTATSTKARSVEVTFVGEGQRAGMISGACPHAQLGDIFEFKVASGSIYGVVVNIWAEVAWMYVVGEPSGVCAVGMKGEQIQDQAAADEVYAVPHGSAVGGRILNHNGEPVDGKGPLSTEGLSRRRISDWQPHIKDRAPIDSPVMTGYKSIDALTPLGKGQAMLIYGEEGMGKTTLAVDTILAQKGKVRCVYVALNQTSDQLSKVTEALREGGAMDTTTIIHVPSDADAAQSFMAPILAVTMAEAMRDSGEDVLIVYDDLNHHIATYTDFCAHLDESSTLLHNHILWRTFYSGIIQRSANMGEKLGSGSLTSLLLLQSPDLAPDEMMSVSDGQIFLSKKVLETNGLRPPINLQKSLSRIGVAALAPSLKAMCGPLRGAMLQQNDEIKTMGKKGMGIRRQDLDTLERLWKHFQQPAHAPESLSNQTLGLFSLLHPRLAPFMAKIPIDDTTDFVQLFIERVSEGHPAITDKLNAGLHLNEEDDVQLRLAVVECLNSFSPSSPPPNAAA